MDRDQGQDLCWSEGRKKRSEPQQFGEKCGRLSCDILNQYN